MYLCVEIGSLIHVYVHINTYTYVIKWHLINLHAFDIVEPSWQHVIEMHGNACISSISVWLCPFSFCLPANSPIMGQVLRCVGGAARRWVLTAQKRWWSCQGYPNYVQTCSFQPASTFPGQSRREVSGRRWISYFSHSQVTSFLYATDITELLGLH